MLQLLVLFSTLFTISSVHVSVADAQGVPLPDVQVKLVLYEYRSNSAVQITFSDSCSTDQNGECTILIGETTGLLRGRLDLGKYGGRDVIWPSGVLNAPILVDLENNRVKGAEAQAFEFQEKDGGVRIESEVSWFRILIMVLTTIGFVTWLYLESRREQP